MRAGAARLRLAHDLRDDSEVELTRVVLEADGNALDDEVHGRVIEGSRRRLAQLHLETGGGQRGPQIRGELRVSAVAVVDEEARALNVANGPTGGRGLFRRSGSEPRRRTRRPIAVCTPGCAAVLADRAQGGRQQPGGLVLADAADKPVAGGYRRRGGALSQLGVAMALRGEIGAHEQRGGDLVVGPPVATRTGQVEHPRHVDGCDLVVGRLGRDATSSPEDVRQHAHWRLSLTGAGIEPGTLKAPKRRTLHPRRRAYTIVKSVDVASRP
jgi:hypothetical protein